MRARLLFCGLALCGTALACFVPTVDLTGKACDVDHPCAAGFVCIDGICLTAPDAPPPDGGLGDAGAGCTRPRFCLDGDLYQCRAGQGERLEACANRGLGCDPDLGCLAPCDEGRCAEGHACDTSRGLCLRTPSCQSNSDCGDAGLCLEGACLASPPTGNAADLGCYREAPDAGTSRGAEVMLDGFLVTPSDHRIDQSVGYELDVYLAEEFHEQSEPEAIASTTVDHGDTTEFRFGPVPTGVPLVARVQADGGLATYQYFTLPPAPVPGDVQHPLTSWGAEDWQRLTESAGVELEPGRGGVAAQLFDCGSPPRWVGGATGALSVPSQARYTEPTLLAIDPEARASSGHGRFFFLNTPVMRTGLVAGVAADGGEIQTVSTTLRTVGDAVTVVPLRPPGR